MPSDNENKKVEEQPAKKLMLQSSSTTSSKFMMVRSPIKTRQFTAQPAQKPGVDQLVESMNIATIDMMPMTTSEESSVRQSVDSSCKEWEPPEEAMEQN